MDGHLAYADYVREEGRLLITHVFTPSPLRGGGVASQLMQQIVAWAHERQLKLTPLCSYARAWMDRHPEHRDLLHLPD